MNRELAVRVLGLYGPIAIAAVLWAVAAGDRKRTGAAVLVACAWTAPALLLLHLLAARAGWWTFRVAGGTFAGFPVDLYLGWIVLWGAVPVLGLSAAPLPVAALTMLWIDLLVMPRCAPVVALGEAWIVGELVAIAVVLVPALQLARWTANDRRLAARSTLQVLAFTGLTLLVIPAAALEYAGGGWGPLLERPVRWNGMLAQILALPAVLGLSAVQEFVTRGGGTPVPYDPPRRLVTTGPYAYVANPMQLAMCLVFVIWAVMLESAWVGAAGVMAFAYSAGLATWHEREELRERFGPDWTSYRRAVRQWIPRWRPYVSSPARLYVAESCGLCQDVARWLAARGAIGLDVLPAESHPTRQLTRITYEHADEVGSDEGVAAFARALDHLHFGWAFVGMIVRLPLVNPVLRLLADASGGHPRRIPVGKAENPCSPARPPAGQ